MGRSRGGCSNCKRRKRKCDETRPGCQACQKRGIDCEGYTTTLRWTNGIASRGRFAGATVPGVAASDSSSSSATFTAYLPTDDDPRPYVRSCSASPRVEGMTQKEPTQNLDPSRSNSGIASLAPSPSAIIDRNRYLFQRFIDTGIHRLYSTESQSWLKKHFSAMAEKSQAFSVVCGAIQEYLDDGFSVSSMEHVDHALQTFRAELESRHGSFDASTVSAGILLCTLCLFQARPWTKYLHLMADLYHLKTSMSCLLPSSDHVFEICHSIEVMSIMDMEPMVIGRMAPSMGVWRCLRTTQDNWKGGRLGGIEVVSGLPRTLLDILADIGNANNQDLEARLWNWPGEIGVHAQCILWDCWRYAAVLDTRRKERQKKQRAAAETDQSVADTLHTPYSPSTEIVMCRLAASVYALHRAVELPTNSHLLVLNGLVYPLVIASLEVPLLVAHPEWKEVFDHVRSSFLKKDKFRLMKVIDDIIEEAWKEGTDTFDIEEAARIKGVEIAVY